MPPPQILPLMLPGTQPPPLLPLAGTGQPILPLHAPVTQALRGGRRPLLLVMLLGLLMLAGCAQAPTPRPAPPPSLSQQAAALEAGGDVMGAAQLYLRGLTEMSPDAQRDALLSASEILMRHGMTAQAQALWQRLPTPPPPLSPLHAFRLGLLHAQLAMAEQRPLDALTVLPSPPGDDIPLALRRDYHRLQAEAFDLGGNHLESARERAILDTLLTEPAAQQANQLALWDSLLRLSDTALRRLQPRQPQDVLAGWMELVYLVRSQGQREDFDLTLQDWRQRYPNHPAQLDFLQQLQGQMHDIQGHPQQLALLLPLSGSLGKAGQAVRDGFLAAYLATDKDSARPVLRVYDVGDGPHSVWSQYQQAVLDGAQLVVGPLDKDSVDELAHAATLEVPVLALNYSSENDFPPGLYQFGLAPEDEAREVARRAQRDGHRRALALVPGTEWGERVLSAFSEEWALLGGVLLEAQAYDPQRTDFADPIRGLLNLDDSDRRRRALADLLGQRLDAEPRRRQDAELVFLAAYTPQARQLKPQLRFHHASGLPVYATSHVSAGPAQQTPDPDLNGIRFCEMPWLLEEDALWKDLRNDLARTWPDAARYTRLHALGIDAYRVLPVLGQLGQGTFSRYNGVTGNLYLDAQQRIHRELGWARFRGGVPEALPESLPNSTTEPESEPMEDTAVIDS